MRLSLRPVPQGPPVRPSALAEGIFRREILPWGLLGLALGLVEGATAAVLVKQHFASAAPSFIVNLAVAAVSGAPAFSNVLSFVWANIAHGRARVQLMVALQAGFALLVGCVSFASRGSGGLLLTVLSIIAARVLWAGVLTVRAAVWTANYPRNVLARITGRIVIVNAITVAISAALVGWALEAHVLDARWLYGGGALAGLAAAWLYRAMRVRREFRLLAAEAGSATRSEPFSLRTVRLAAYATHAESSLLGIHPLNRGEREGDILGHPASRTRIRRRTRTLLERALDNLECRPIAHAAGNLAHVRGRKLLIPVQIYDLQHVNSPINGQ